MRARLAITRSRPPPTALSSPKSAEFARPAARSRSPLRLSSVRRHRQRRQLSSARRQPVRRQAARDRESADAGVDIVPVTTIVNGVNNEQVGRVIQFALDNPRKILVRQFSAGIFTGRDEEITDERRQAQRYTLEPSGARREESVGLANRFATGSRSRSRRRSADWADLVHGLAAEFGGLSLRLPSELRRRHGGHDRQGNEGGRAGDGVPQGDQTGEGRAPGERRRPRRCPR